ncbi:MAG TPA: hypothetical protein EYP33_08310 [Pyrodictium sp.]|nr:hypothetical protein [Pyrodictium sp.]
MALIASAAGVAVFTFTIVFRVVEAVLLVAPFLTRNAIGTIGGVAAGSIAAPVIAYAIYVAGLRVSLKGILRNHLPAARTNSLGARGLRNA